MKATMPGIAIELNGSHFITIDLAGMDVVDVSVHGALDQAPKAVLYVHGGNALELETLTEDLLTKYDFSLLGIWSEKLTLGELFACVSTPRA